MSPGEIAWRVQGVMRGFSDQRRIKRGSIPVVDIQPDGRSAADTETGFRFPRPGDSTPDRGRHRARTIAEADLIASGRLSFFDLEEQPLGQPIDWHRDFNQDLASPRTLSARINYRDARVAGDCKLVWEPNRHHQWLTLAQAYVISGDEKYATAFIEQIRGWLNSNPYGYGMNWRSPLELGIRLISWIWAIDLVRPSGLIDDDLWLELKRTIYLHCWDVSRKFSRGSSANNHLIGEAAGVFVAACYFRQCPESEAWRTTSRAILLEENVNQSYSDGGNREQTFTYQLFVQQFFLICGLCADWSDESMPDSYWRQLMKSVEFTTAMTAACDVLPMIGDADDGFVYKTDWDDNRLAEHQTVIALRQSDSELAARIRDAPGSAAWLLSTPDPRVAIERLRGDHTPPALLSRQFSDSGYYLLQNEKEDGGSVSLLMDAGELGYGAIAAHGHADALSIMLRANGSEILVDPGTYDYFTYPEWREHFRSTAAHNTLEINGEDQSRILGPFLWSDAANATLKEFTDSNSETKIVATHDGYQRLANPVVHEREVRLDKSDNSIAILDRLGGAGNISVSQTFQFSERCEVSETGSNTFTVRAENVKLEFVVDDKCRCELFRGSKQPGPGWVSRGYHRKQKAWCLRTFANMVASADTLIVKIKPA